MNHISLLCNNESAIKIVYNPCEHFRTKHMDIRHHFLRDHAIKGDIVISHVGTNDQLADIFTKPLDEKWFCELWSEYLIHHWFLKCGLVCCTSDLKLVMLEKYAFMSKILFFAKNYTCSMILMVSSHIYVLIFITCPCTIHTYILYWPYTKIRWISSFSGGFWGFWNCRDSFHRTCLASGPDMSRSRVSRVYKGAPYPLEP
jgi:hypothetical protein